MSEKEENLSLEYNDQREGKADEEEEDWDESKWQLHESKIKDMYCVNCKKRICESCIISGSHFAHSITSFTITFRKTLDKGRAILNNLSKNSKVITKLKEENPTFMNTIREEVYKEVNIIINNATDKILNLLEERAHWIIDEILDESSIELKVNKALEDASSQYPTIFNLSDQSKQFKSVMDKIETEIEHYYISCYQHPLLETFESLKQYKKSETINFIQDDIDLLLSRVFSEGSQSDSSFEYDYAEKAERIEEEMDQSSSDESIDSKNNLELPEICSDAITCIQRESNNLNENQCENNETYISDLVNNYVSDSIQSVINSWSLEDEKHEENQSEISTDPRERELSKQLESRQNDSNPENLNRIKNCRKDIIEMFKEDPNNESDVEAKSIDAKNQSNVEENNKDKQQLWVEGLRKIEYDMIERNCNKSTSNYDEFISDSKCKQAKIVKIECEDDS